MPKSYKGSPVESGVFSARPAPGVLGCLYFSTDEGCVYLDDGATWYPFNFANNEGFVIRSVEVPATGTWKLGVVVEWAEIDPGVVTGWT